MGGGGGTQTVGVLLVMVVDLVSPGTGTTLRGGTGCGGAEGSAAVVTMVENLWWNEAGSDAGGNGCNFGAGGGGYYGGTGGGGEPNGGNGGGGSGYIGGSGSYTVR